MLEKKSRWSAYFFFYLNTIGERDGGSPEKLVEIYLADYILGFFPLRGLVFEILFKGGIFQFSATKAR